VRQRLFTGEVAEGCQVVANASPSMGVRVQAGTMRIPTGTAPANYYYEAAIDTASPGEALTVTTANPSNPRRDFVVAYIDKAVTPSTAVTNNSNSVLKLAVVAGTPASSPSDPTGSQITTAIGASNPYIVLARIAVGTGVTQITNSDIADLRSMMTLADDQVRLTSMPKMKVCRVTSIQPLPTTGPVAIQFNGEKYKSITGMHSNITNPERLICKKSGLYDFTYTLNQSSGYGGGRVIVSYERYNSSGVLQENVELWDGNTDAGEPSRSFAWQSDMNLDDYLTISVHCTTNTGGTNMSSGALLANVATMTYRGAV
jgi:hypothetical protein